MKRYRVGFSRVAEAQVDTIVSWWRENRPATQFCIQRGTRWAGVSFSDGISLVFSCEPQSGIRSARFHLWPWKKIELEKINPGA
jgi:hypothetical protein